MLAFELVDVLALAIIVVAFLIVTAVAIGTFLGYLNHRLHGGPK